MLKKSYNKFQFQNKALSVQKNPNKIGKDYDVEAPNKTAIKYDNSEEIKERSVSLNHRGTKIMIRQQETLEVDELERDIFITLNIGNRLSKAIKRV